MNNRERSKSRTNSKNHQWPSPTRVGIDAPRGERKKKKKVRKKYQWKILLVHVVLQGRCRKNPQKAIWKSGILLYRRMWEKLVVNREINSQVPLVAEPHRGDWGGYFWVTMRTLSACMHECLRQTEPTHLSNFCWIWPHTPVNDIR